jgi:hypothetical protein
VKALFEHFFASPSPGLLSLLNSAPLRLNLTPT